jgi:hypothetical protein
MFKVPQHNKTDCYLPVKDIDKITKYLGMTTMIGRSKNQVFSFIMDWIKGKLMGWKKKKLSFASRRVLIRVVVQAIPSFQPI